MYVSSSSLTHLNGLSGAENYETYGAQFETAEYKTPYYERIERVFVKSPWLGEHREHTYMNRTKERNQEPIQTYKNLKLSPIPAQMYETYVPTIYKIEDSGKRIITANKKPSKNSIEKINNQSTTSSKTIKALIVIAAIIVWYLFIY